MRRFCGLDIDGLLPSITATLNTAVQRYNSPLSSQTRPQNLQALEELVALQHLLLTLTLLRKKRQAVAAAETKEEEAKEALPGPEVLFSPDELKPLFDLFRMRWRCIGGSSDLNYSSNPESPANKAYIQVATALASEYKPEAPNPVEMLLSSGLEAVVELEDEDEVDVRHTHPLTIFVVSDDGRHLIDPLRALNQFRETGQWLLTHKRPLDVPAPLYERQHLSLAEINRVTHMTPQMLDYYSTIMGYRHEIGIDAPLSELDFIQKFQKGKSLYDCVFLLAEKMRQGGFGVSPEGVRYEGTEENAGNTGYYAVCQFQQFLDFLRQNYKDLYDQLMGCRIRSEQGVALEPDVVAALVAAGGIIPVDPLAPSAEPAIKTFNYIWDTRVVRAFGTWDERNLTTCMAGTVVDLDRMLGKDSHLPNQNINYPINEVLLSGLRLSTEAIAAITTVILDEKARSAAASMVVLEHPEALLERAHARRDSPEEALVLQRQLLTEGLPSLAAVSLPLSADAMWEDTMWTLLKGIYAQRMGEANPAITFFSRAEPMVALLRRLPLAHILTFLGWPQVKQDLLKLLDAHELGKVLEVLTPPHQKAVLLKLLEERNVLNTLSKITLFLNKLPPADHEKVIRKIDKRRVEGLDSVALGQLLACPLTPRHKERLLTWVVEQPGALTSWDQIKFLFQHLPASHHERAIRKIQKSTIENLGMDDLVELMTCPLTPRHKERLLTWVMEKQGTLTSVEKIIFLLQHLPPSHHAHLITRVEAHGERVEIPALEEGQPPQIFYTPGVVHLFKGKFAEICQVLRLIKPSEQRTFLEKLFWTPEGMDFATILQEGLGQNHLHEFFAPDVLKPSARVYLLDLLKQNPAVFPRLVTTPEALIAFLAVLTAQEQQPLFRHVPVNYLAPAFTTLEHFSQLLGAIKSERFPIEPLVTDGIRALLQQKDAVRARLTAPQWVQLLRYVPEDQRRLAVAQFTVEELTAYFQPYPMAFPQLLALLPQAILPHSKWSVFLAEKRDALKPRGAAAMEAVLEADAAAAHAERPVPPRADIEQRQALVSVFLGLYSLQRNKGSDHLSGWGRLFRAPSKVDKMKSTAWLIGVYARTTPIDLRPDAEKDIARHIVVLGQGRLGNCLNRRGFTPANVAIALRC